MSYSEQDFSDLSEAAYFAQESGDAELAKRLDTLARKANADLSRQHVLPYVKFGSGSRKKIRWQDMPSTLL